jgi:hypothetical protein
LSSSRCVKQPAAAHCYSIQSTRVCMCLCVCVCV